MRKVLSFVLVLALVLGSFSMAFADFSDMSGEASSEAVSVLKDLGVVAGYPDGTFRPDQIVTRAEMARFIIAALGLEEYATGTTSKYPDMVQAPWAQGYVAYATSIGFISGYPDGTFKPNQQVSYQEAASMLVRALGYTEAFLPGGWPAEWMIKGNSLGLFDDVTMTSGAAGANRGDIAQMIYNALPMGIGYVDADNKWNWNGSKEGDDTMLKRLGAVVEAVDVLEYTVDTKINILPYIGMKGDVYTYKGDIISFNPSSTLLTGKLVTNTATSKFRATNGVDYVLGTNAKYDTLAPYFLNAEYVTDSSITVKAGSTTQVAIAVKISGTTITELHSISEWQVTAASKITDAQIKKIADDNMLLDGNFAEDSSQAIDTNSFWLVGVNSLSNIVKDDIVYVYEAAGNGDIRKVAVGQEEVSGLVTAKSSADKAKFTVGGKVYALSSNEVGFGTATNSNVEVGNEYDFRLDAYGNIYSATLVSKSADNYGVILAWDAGSALDDSRLRLFLADGTTKTFVTDLGTGSAVPGASGVTTGYAVAYSVDKDGVIDKLEKASFGSAAMLTGKSVLSVGGTTYPVDSSVVVFINSSSEAGLTVADDLDMSSLGKVELNKQLAIDSVFTYILDDGEVVAMVVDSAAAEADADDVFGVVNDVSAVYNTDTEKTVNRIVGFADGAAMDKWTSFSYDAAWKGILKGTGVFKVVFNSDGEIKSITNGGITVANGSNTVFDGLNGAKTALSVTTGGVATWYSLNTADLVVYEAVWNAGNTAFDKYVVSSIDSISDGNFVYMYDVDTSSGNDGIEIVIWTKKAL